MHIVSKQFERVSLHECEVKAQIATRFKIRGDVRVDRLWNVSVVERSRMDPQSNDQGRSCFRNVKPAEIEISVILLSHLR